MEVVAGAFSAISPPTAVFKVTETVVKASVSPSPIVLIYVPNARGYTYVYLCAIIMFKLFVLMTVSLMDGSSTV